MPQLLVLHERHFFGLFKACCAGCSCLHWLKQDGLYEEDTVVRLYAQGMLAYVSTSYPIVTVWRTATASDKAIAGVQGVNSCSVHIVAKQAQCPAGLVCLLFVAAVQTTQLLP